MGARSALAALLAFFFLSGPCAAQSAATGQSLYLPIYSHIWHGDVSSRGQPTKTLVSVLVSIRNTDPAKSIRVTSARYYDTGGKLIKDYVATAVTIPPMGTHEIFVPRGDDVGGSGANFVIAWQADSRVSPPLVEGVHANLPAGRAIVFITTARPIAGE